MALRLHTLSVGPIQLPAAPAGGSSSYIAFRLTSAAGPFCVVGFYVNPVPDAAGSSPGGPVTIALGRINGEGVIHPEIQIADYGVRPQDLVVSYGSVLSSSSSLSFHVNQSPAATGPGRAYRLYGTVTFFADELVTLTVTSETP